MSKGMNRLYRVKNGDTKAKLSALRDGHKNSQLSFPDCLFRNADWYCEIELNNIVTFRRVLYVWQLSRCRDWWRGRL